MSDPRYREQEREQGREGGTTWTWPPTPWGRSTPRPARTWRPALREGADQGLCWRLAEYRAVTALLPHAAVPQALPPRAWNAVLSRVREDRQARSAPTWRTRFAPIGHLAASPWRPPGRRPGGRRRSRGTPAAGALAPAATAVVALLLWNVTLQRQLLDLPLLPVPRGPAGAAP